MNKENIMKKTLFFLICLAFLILSCGKQEKTAQPQKTKEAVALFPIKYNGKWGYIDETGIIIINPQYDTASEFFEGLALIEIGGKKGYIDKTGKKVISPEF